MAWMNYRMAPLSVTLSDLKGHFSQLNHLQMPYLGKHYTLLARMCLHTTRKAYVAYSFNCRNDAEGLLGVTDRHVC